MQAKIKCYKLVRVKKVLVIIPAFNEAENIVSVISEVKERYPNYDVLVVNDGSRDRTGFLAEQTKNAFVVHLPYNMGIGASVQTGFKFAKNNNYDIALQVDGDGQHLIEEIEKIIGPIENEMADCAIGSRFIQDKKNYKPRTFRLLGIYLLRMISFLLIRQRIADQTSGFRAYNRKAIKFLAVHYPVDYPEPELIILLGRNDFRIVEVFTQMRERQGGISSIPVWRGPYYMTKVILSMTMAALRSKKIKTLNLSDDG